MRKSKFLVLVLVLSIALMGAGYAAWQDTVTVNHVINTGQLDVHFVRTGTEVTVDALDSEYIDTNVRYGHDEEGGQNDLDVATATLNDVYPGAKFRAEFKMKNNSTMPVEVASVDWSPWNEWEFAGLTSSGMGMEYLNAAGDLVETIPNFMDPAQYAGIQVPEGGFIRIYVNYTAGENLAENTEYTLHVAPTFKQFNK
jgi:hypothetical protein